MFARICYLPDIALGGRSCFFSRLELRRRSRLGADDVQIGCAAAVLTAALLPREEARALQVRQRPFDRGAGEVQICGDALDPRPTLALGVGAVAQVHIDADVAVGEVGGVDRIEISHVAASLAPNL